MYPQDRQSHNRRDRTFGVLGMLAGAVLTLGALDAVAAKTGVHFAGPDGISGAVVGKITLSCQKDDGVLDTVTTVMGEMAAMVGLADKDSQASE